MLRRPFQTDQARRVHRALSHPEDAPEALLDQCRGVPDLNADAGLLPGCAGPLGEDLRSQPVRRLVDQIPGQCRGLGQRQGSRQRLLPLGGVGKGGDDGDARERRGPRRGLLLPGAVLILRRVPGVGAQSGSVCDGGELLLAEGGQCQDGGVGPGQCSGGASGGSTQEAGLVIARRRWSWRAGRCRPSPFRRRPRGSSPAPGSPGWSPPRRAGAPPSPGRLRNPEPVAESPER